MIYWNTGKDGLAKVSTYFFKKLLHMCACRFDHVFKKKVQCIMAKFLKTGLYIVK